VGWWKFVTPTWKVVGPDTHYQLEEALGVGLDE